MFTLNCKGRLLLLDGPVVMGIINSTPDSFHAASRADSIEDAVNKAGEMLAKGALILDIGGQSTRPGSKQIDAEMEAERVIPIIAAIHQKFPDAVISIDTYYASVAKAAVEAGASMVNDISAGLFDEKMLATVAALKTPYILMHIKGDAAGMHQKAQTENISREVFDFFIERIEACKKAGIHDIILDPGFGFGKTIADNFRLVKDLSLFTPLDKPLLLGVSRKSSIYKTLGGSAATALNGTTVLHTVGLMNGANIIRVHDVQEAVEAIQLTNLIRK